MKFAVGYQLFPDSYFIDNIIRRKEGISEVYFSWGDFPNGRNSQHLNAGMTPWETTQKQLEDLKKLSEEGIALDLLFNATCYGKDSLSKAFFRRMEACSFFLLYSANYFRKTVDFDLIF